MRPHHSNPNGVGPDFLLVIVMGARLLFDLGFRLLVFIRSGPRSGRRGAMTLAFLVGTGAMGAIEVESGFVAETILENLNAATTFVVAPDGRLLITDQTGKLLGWREGDAAPMVVLDISERLDTYWERGLIGVTLGPNFPAEPYIFVMYVAKDPWTHHVISRFTLRGDVIDPASERVLLQGDDQTKIGGKIPWGHQGGPMLFGPDGCLYLGIGEQTAGEASQSLATLQGKILRINADGTIPQDNPFYGETTGKYRSIWALGIRNPYGMVFEPGSAARLWVSDVGQTSWEEVNIVTRGGNFGWPEVEGVGDGTRFINPVYTYPPAIGRCISGGTFVPDLPGYPESWRGRFFFADWSSNWMKSMDPRNVEDRVTIARGLNGVVAMQPTADGSLLVLNRGTIWRDGKRWRQDTGFLVRIRARRAGEVAPVQSSWVPQLSELGLFNPFPKLKPTAGLIAYDLVAPPWLPGTQTRNWIRLPLGGQLGIDDAGEFEFPAGTVVVQHHIREVDGRPWETHVYRFQAGGEAMVAAYRWSAAGDDATLVTDAGFDEVPGEPGVRWLSPAPDTAWNPSHRAAGFQLALAPGQLVRNGIWQEWQESDMLDAAAQAHRPVAMAALDDETASAGLRVRSFLGTNCATCHQPGGAFGTGFDARFQTPLERTGLINGAVTSANFDRPHARLIIPGRPEDSVVALRLHARDGLRMPPIALSDEDPPVLLVLEEWIQSLSTTSAAP